MSGLFPQAKRNRRERIKKLELAIKENSGDVKETVANFCLSEGIALRKVKEYLKLLKLSGKIVDDVEI